MFLHDLRAGGAERISVNLANAIALKRHDIDLVLVNMEGCRTFFDQLNESVRVIALPQSRTLTSALGFRAYIEEARPDLVISALTHINISALIAHKLCKHKPKITVVEHGQFSRECQKPMPAFVRLAYRAAPWLYPEADVIATVSEGAKHDLSNAIGVAHERISVLYNPVMTERLLEASFEPVGHPWFNDRERPIVLAVGALRTEKNFPLLIDAFAIIRQKRFARLVILGEGPEYAKIAKCAETSAYAADIALLGFEGNPLKYMRHAAVLALSSDHEALPTVLIEAMACGTPVVATDCPSGPSEILLGGELGALAKVGDPASLAGALENVLDRPTPPDLLIRRAAHFSAEKAAERYLS